MVYSNKKMLIFHTDHTVQIKLEAACRPLGEIQLVQSSDEALEAANIQNFDLLLLQWEFPSDDGMGDIQTIFHLQPQSVKVALVYPPNYHLLFRPSNRVSPISSPARWRRNSSRPNWRLSYPLNRVGKKDPLHCPRSLICRSNGVSTKRPAWPRPEGCFLNSFWY